MKGRTLGILLLVLVLGGAVLGHRPEGVAYAQGITVGPLQLLLAQDGCRPSAIPGPPYPDRGDTLTIVVTITNNSSRDEAYRVVFRVIGTTGGIGRNRTVDLLYGGPTYMHLGQLAGGGWDDSFGMVVNTPIIRAGETFPVRANFSLYRRQLTHALNIPDNTSVPLTFKVEVFNRDFSRIYASTEQTQYVTNRRVASCTQLPYDASPLVVLTDQVNYRDSDTVYVEWSYIGADKERKVPAWGDRASGTIEVVLLNDPPTGSPEKDYRAGTVVKTLDIWNRSDTPPCAKYCTAQDEAVGVELSYAHLQGDGNQAFTNWVSFPASDLPNNRYFLVRFRPANTLALDLIKQPQWTYFSVGDPLAVRLASFEAIPQAGHVLLTWETVSEVDNLGFDLYRRVAGTKEAYLQVNEVMIPSRSPGGGAGATYTFVDGQVQPGVLYEYLLEDIDVNGRRTSHGPAWVQAPYFVVLPLIER